MAKLYGLHNLNNFHEGFNRTVLNFELDGIFASGCHYIQYEDSDNKSVDIRLSLDKITGELHRVVFLLSKEPIFCDNDLDLTSYLSLKCSPHFAIEEPWPNSKPFPYLTIQQPIKAYLYNSAMLIDLNEQNRPQFFFQECDNFGILTDKDFIINGFVVLNFTIEDQEVLNELMWNKNLQLKNCEKKQSIALKKRVFAMQDKQFLSNTILKLKNVSLVELIYYGYAKQIIDEEFVIDFATQYLEHKGTDEQIWVELASIDTKKRDKKSTEGETTLHRLERAVKDSPKVLTNRMPFYNKIWFYLFSVSNMHELNLIE